MSFHTFTLPEDRCARLLVKNLGRGMPESVVREELETLGIHVHGLTLLRSGRRDQDPPRTALPPPTSLYQGRVALRCPRCAHSPNSAACECRWSRTWLQRALCNASAASASDTRSETAVTRLGVSRVGAPTCLAGAQPRGCGGNHTAKYSGCVKWKEAKTALAKQAPQRAPKNAATGYPAAPKAQQAGPSAEQLALGEGWSHVVRGGVLPRLRPPLRPLIQIPLLNRSRSCPGSLK